jgi:outer membrane protein assembly factor BamB
VTQTDLFGQAVVGLDQRTGVARSRIPIGAPWPTSDIAADRDSVYVTLYAPDRTVSVSAYAAASCSVLGCSPRWTATVPGSTSAHAVVAGGVLYVTSGVDVYAFDAAGCGQATCRPAADLTVSTNVGRVIVAGGRLYAGASDDRGDVVAFAPATA